MGERQRRVSALRVLNDSASTPVTGLIRLLDTFWSLAHSSDLSWRSLDLERSFFTSPFDLLAAGVL
eukprot:scaffold154984_cov31-Tisochrysis_lutea.AAC.5